MRNNTTIQSRAIISGFILTSLIVLLSTTQLTTTSLLPQQANAQLSTTDLSSIASRIHELVNQARQQNGLSALSSNDNLERIALAHSQDMANTGTLSHDGSDGSSMQSRITSVQGPNVYWGENIYYTGTKASNDAVAQEAFNWWMNSPGHRGNILSSNFVMEGVGVAQASNGNIYFTQDFSSQPSTTTTSPTTNQPSNSSSQTSTASASAPDPSSIASRIHELVNQARQQNGLSALSRNSDLDGIALAHSQDMASQNSFSSTGSDGSTSQSRIQGVRGPNVWWGEGISWTSSSGDPNTIAQQAYNSLNRADVLSSNYTVDGIGVAQASDGRIYMTVDFSS